MQALKEIGICFVGGLAMISLILIMFWGLNTLTKNDAESLKCAYVKVNK